MKNIEVKVQLQTVFDELGTKKILLTDCDLNQNIGILRADFFEKNYNISDYEGLIIKLILKK